MYKEYKMEKKNQCSTIVGFSLRTLTSQDSSQFIHFDINVTIIDKVPTPV